MRAERLLVALVVASVVVGPTTLALPCSARPRSDPLRPAPNLELPPCAEIFDLLPRGIPTCLLLAPYVAHAPPSSSPSPPSPPRDSGAWDAYRRSADPTLRVLDALLRYGTLLDPNERLEPHAGEMVFKLTPARLGGGAFGLTLSGAF